MTCILNSGPLETTSTTSTTSTYPQKCVALTKSRRDTVAGPLWFPIARQIPIPNGQLDLRLQSEPNLPVSLRPGLGLREALLGLPPMLGIGGRDPCSALLGPWTSGPPPVKTAPG